MSDATTTGSGGSGSPVEMMGVIPDDLLERDRLRPFDPAPGLQGRRDGPPVTELVLGNGVRAWLVTGFEESRAVLADPRMSNDRMRHPVATGAARGATPSLGPDDERHDGMFIFMDPPEHTRFRSLLTAQFTPRRIRALEDRLREIAAERIETMRAAGTTADLVESYALPLPSAMICEMLGVDYADRAEFQQITSTMLSSTASAEDRAAAGGALYGFISGLVAAKRAARTDDILSGLAHDADPPLTDAQLVDVSLVLLGAGHETTANMLGLGVFALLQNPDQLTTLREDPQAVDSAVEELLRFLSIIQLGVTRVATEDVALGGVTIPAGATVVIGTPEANRDTRRWEAPDRLDVRRERYPHLAFGHGVHACLGHQLARSEMRVGLSEIITRLPDLRLDIDAAEVPLRNDMLVFGVHSLPVAWGRAS